MRSSYPPALLSFASCVAAFTLPFSGKGQELLVGDTTRDAISVGEPHVLSLHRTLVKIPSVTGDERGIGNFLVDFLSKHNFTVETQRVSSAGAVLTTSDGSITTEKERFNVYAYPGKKRSTRTLVTSHIDTVPPYLPYDRTDKDVIWGRGSVDAKGSVATQIAALMELLLDGKVDDGDVSLLFVVGEEIGGDGMRKVNDLGLEWETVIFGEPTELKLATGHKGSLSFQLHAQGKAAHSGYPYLGVNANSMLIPALAALDSLNMPASEKYGNSTLNIGKMSGGVAGNVVAESADAMVQIRIAAGTSEEMKKIVLDAVSVAAPHVEVIFNSGGYGPIDIDADIDGFEHITVNYGTDIPNLYGDHKKYLYGPGSILEAHSAHEHLTISDLETAVEGYKKLILASLM